MVSCMGYVLLFKAAFELGSVMGWELRHWAPDLGQLGENEAGSGWGSLVLSGTSSDVSPRARVGRGQDPRGKRVQIALS